MNVHCRTLLLRTSLIFVTQMKEDVLQILENTRYVRSSADACRAKSKPFDCIGSTDAQVHLLPTFDHFASDRPEGNVAHVKH